MQNSENSGKFSARGGRFNYFKQSGTPPVPPPDEGFLIDEDSAYIVTDDGGRIIVV